MHDRIRIVEEELLSDNWGTLVKVTFDMEERSGNWRRHKREVYNRGDAACVLLYNVRAGTILLVRQFRIPVYQVGDKRPWLLEVCAGVLDGDDPETCARREAEEESGYRPRNLQHCFDSYMSPGSVTEKLSFYLAEYGPEDKVTEGGGLESEGEDIEVVELQFSEAMAMVKRGEIVDGKTILLLQQLALSGLMNR